MARKRARLAAIGVAAVMAAGATVSTLSPALAQDATEAPEADKQTRRQRHEERRDDFATALAEELGLPAEQVKAAIDKVEEEQRAEAKARRLARLKERLDAAVEAGTLTREQADAIYAAAESGAPPFDGRGGRGRHGRHRGGPPPEGAEPALEGAEPAPEPASA